MPAIELFTYQAEALKKMHNGCILCGGVGTGKSCVGLAYVYTRELKGTMKINGEGAWTPPTVNKDIYIITTAMKRDSKEWDMELYRYGLSTDAKHSVNGIKVVVDSWNNIKKYDKIFNSVFIFDEDRVTGKGAWVKAFLKIARKNRWILLSASPGDSYQDYVPVFIANGYFKNRSEFNAKHIVFVPFLKYPQIDHYVNTGILAAYRRELLVPMEPPKKNERVKHDILCKYNKAKYKTVWRERWDPYDSCPIDETGKLCYLLRRVVNEDNDRIQHLIDILKEHDKAIIFYNFSFELDILRKVCSDLGFKIGERNGVIHDLLPDGKKWVYLVQYASGSEGWNGKTTDTMIFYSLNYSYKTMLQAAGRIDRLNTPFPELHYYYLKSTAPIDVAIGRALSQKKQFNESAFIKAGGK